jgi:predicted naringenin-chalcone synthase
VLSQFGADLGACALLRLAVQKLCIELEQKGENLNEDIGNLVKKGLSVEVQQALDALRVIGNNAVHPGELDVADDVRRAIALFECLNLIVEQLIAQARRVADLYSNLPQAALQAIEERDR